MYIYLFSTVGKGIKRFALVYGSVFCLLPQQLIFNLHNDTAFVIRHKLVYVNSKYYAQAFTIVMGLSSNELF